MTLSWLVLLAGCGDAFVPVSDTDATLGFGRQLDSGLVVEAQCADPGFCGCDYVGYDLALPLGEETCVHSTATVLGDLGVGARVEAGAFVAERASVGAGSVIGLDAVVAPHAAVGEDSTIGQSTVVARGATVGDRTDIGDDSMIGRASTIGNDVDISIGQFTIGYNSTIGDRTEVTGTNVVVGNLASIGADSIIGGNVVVARGLTFGENTTLGAGAIIGPEVSALSNVTIGAGSRLRKGTTIADDVVIGTGVRLGRNSEVREGATIGDDATLGAYVTVGTYYPVEPNSRIPRQAILEDRPGGRVADAPPVVVITSPLDGADSDSGSLTIGGTIADDFGVTSLTVRIDGGTPVSIPFSNGQFSATVTGIPDLSHTIQVTAFDASGNEGTDFIYVSDCNPDVPVTHTWTGAVSNDWNTDSNWSPTSVPVPASSVFICGDTPTQPQLAANTTIDKIYMDWDANLASDGRILTVTSTYAGGVTSGTGTVRMNSGSTIHGTVPNLDVNGNVVLSGITTATLDVLLSGGVRRLYVGPHMLNAEGNLSQYITATEAGLVMRDPLGRVNIDGTASFSGSKDMNQTELSSPMSAGIIRVGGNVSLPCSGSYPKACFAPTGTEVIMDGLSPQTLSIARGTSGLNRFDALRIDNPTTVTVTGTLVADKSISVGNGATVHATTVQSLGAAGLNEFSGDSTFNVTSSATIAGPIEVLDTSTLNITTLTAGSTFVMSPETTYAGNAVTLQTELVIPSDNYGATTTTISGQVTVHEDWDHTMPNLVLSGTSRLFVGDLDFRLNGNFSQYISATESGLFFTDDNANVTITGNSSFSGSTSMNQTSASSMDKGTLRLQGDVSLPCSGSYPKACFAPPGTHVILDGTAPQIVAIAYGSTGLSRFDALTVTNPTSVTVTGTFVADDSVSLANGATLNATNLQTVNSTGVNTFSQDSVLNISGSATLAGPIEVQDTSELHIGSLTAGSTFVMSPASVYTGNTVTLQTELVIPSDNYSATTTNIAGNITVLGDWDHTIPHMSISGSNRLYVGDLTFRLDGSFSQYISATESGLYFTDDNANVTITGDSSFSGSTDMNQTSASSMDRGTLHLQGDVSLPCSGSYPKACFAPPGTHVILDGTEPQTVAITYGSTGLSRFDALSVTNPTSVTVTGTFVADASLSLANGTTLNATNLTTVSGADLNSFSDGSVLNISGAATIPGPIAVQDTSELNIGTLTAGSTFVMSPTSVYTGNIVNLQSELVIPSDNYSATTTNIVGNMTVQADWDHTMPYLAIASTSRLFIGDVSFRLDGNFSQYISHTDAGLFFTHPNADATITGESTFSGSNHMNVTAGSPMNQGTLHLQGDVTLPCSGAYPKSCFRPIGTAVIMDGTSPQAISISYGGSGRNSFHALAFNNPAGVTVATGSVFAASDMTVLGPVTVNSGRVLDTNGDLTVDGATLTNSGTTRYNGTLTLTNGGVITGNTAIQY